MKTKLAVMFALLALVPFAVAACGDDDDDDDIGDLRRRPRRPRPATATPAAAASTVVVHGRPRRQPRLRGGLGDGDGRNGDDRARRTSPRVPHDVQIEGRTAISAGPRRSPAGPRRRGRARGRATTPSTARSRDTAKPAWKARSPSNRRLPDEANLERRRGDLAGAAEEAEDAGHVRLRLGVRRHAAAGADRRRARRCRRRARARRRRTASSRSDIRWAWASIAASGSNGSRRP